MHNQGAAQIRMSGRCTYRRHLLLISWTRRANSVQTLFCHLSDDSTLCAKRTVSHDNRFFSPVREDLCVSGGRPSIRRRCPRRITHCRGSKDTGHFWRCHRRGLVSRSGNRRSEAHERALTGAGFCVGREMPSGKFLHVSGHKSVATRQSPKIDHPSRLVSRSSAMRPRCELPDASRPGDHTAIEALPGAIARMPPPTPLFPGRPTR
jgi:hypothetical protein